MEEIVRRYHISKYQSTGGMRLEGIICWELFLWCFEGVGVGTKEETSYDATL